METGKTGRTDGLAGASSPVTNTVPETEEIGKTTAQQTVVKTEPKINIPKGKVYRAGVKLRDRLISVTKRVGRLLRAFFQNYFLHNSPADIHKAEWLIEKCSEKLGRKDIDPHFYYDDYSDFWVNGYKQGTPGHKACLLLIETGLVSIKKYNNFDLYSNSTHIFLNRPYNQQVRQNITEFFIDNVPLHFNADGLDWVKIFGNIDPVLGNNLLISGMVVRDGRGGYKGNFKHFALGKKFERLTELQSTPKPGSQASWQTRLQQLRAIARKEHTGYLDTCLNAISGTLTDESLNVLHAIAGKLREGNEYAIADELDMAYKTLTNQKPSTSSQSKAPSLKKTINATPESLKTWEGVMPVLRDIGLIDKNIDLHHLSELGREYDGILPFKLEDLAVKAMLWDKQQKLQEYHNELKVQELADKAGLWDGLLTLGEDCKSHLGEARGVYEEASNTDLRYSFGKLAPELLKREPVTSFSYDQNHWQVAYRKMEGL